MLQPILALLLAGTAPVTIYVGPVVRNGFVETDKGIRDSVKDIQAELRKTKAVRIVDSEKDAAMSLYVLGRAIGPPNGDGTAVTIPVGDTRMSFAVSAKTRHVDTLLRVGDYERAFVGDDHDTQAWRECAEAIAKDVSVWLEANRERVAGR